MLTILLLEKEECLTSHRECPHLGLFDSALVDPAFMDCFLPDIEHKCIQFISSSSGPSSVDGNHGFVCLILFIFACVAVQ